MTYQDRKKLIIYLCIFIYGVSLVLFTLGCAEDYTETEICAYVLLGILLAIAACILGFRKFKYIRHNGSEFTENEKAADANSSETDFQTSRFLEHYSRFWNGDSSASEITLLSDVTQIYYHILMLHKERLKRLGIRMSFSAAKRKYTDNPKDENTYEDGNYEVTDSNCQIEAVRCYYHDDLKAPFCVRRDKELAHMTVLNAKHAGNNMVHCPNCGCLTTKEALIDGCDYCGTKFVVEDLKSRISGFALFDDADLSYAKYKDARIDRAFYAFYIFFAIMYLLVYLCMMLILMEPSAVDTDPMNPLFGAFSIAGITACFAAIMGGVLMAVYIFVILPISEIRTAVNHNKKKQLENLRMNRSRDAELENKIRKFDPLFSIQNFYLGVQNKLAAIIYAQNTGQIAAFTVKDHSELKDEFKDTFDMDVLCLAITDYQKDDIFQKAEVEAEVNCYELQKEKTEVKYRKIKMQLKKSAQCMTHSVCEPYVLTCENCGNSLSLEEGLVCQSCGTKAELFKYDWVIDDISVK